MISNFRRVVNVVFFLLGDSPACEFSVPTFRNILFHLHMPCEQEDSSCSHGIWRWNRMFRNVGTENSDAGESPKSKSTTYLCLTSPFICFLRACHSGCPTYRISHVNGMHDSSSLFHDINFIQMIFTDFAISHTALWKNADNKDNESKNYTCVIIKAA